MRKMLPISAAAVAMLGVAALVPARAQTVFDVPDEVVGDAVDVGGAIVTAPVRGPYPRRAYYGGYEPGPYVYAPAPRVVQCGLGFGCRSYPADYWDRW